MTPLVTEASLSRQPTRVRRVQANKKKGAQPKRTRGFARHT
jgi:hypothetical protein